MLKVLEVSKIISVKNIRNEHDKDIAELADSINRQGLINPITVMQVSGGKYRVIAGHRRLEAVKRLGLPHIECQVLESMSEKDIVLTQLAENVQRKNMSAQELVDVFEELKEKYEEAKEASKQNLEETQDIPTMVCVQEHNWLALISQLKLLTDTLFDVKAQTDETMTYAQMERYLRNQQKIYDQLLEQGKEIQEQTSQNVTAEISKLDQVAKELVSQAGRLNEQTLSQLKCSEEQSRSHGFRLLRLVVLIEVLHLISSVALLLWLR